MVIRPSLNLHHGALSVRSMEESIAFFRDVFGFEVDTQVEVNDGFKIAHLKLGSNYIELFELANAQALPEHANSLNSDLRVIGTKHIAFETDDAEAMYEFLVSQSVKMETEIMDHPDYKYFFFKDPNGILMEFVSRKP